MQSTSTEHTFSLTVFICKYLNRTWTFEEKSNNSVFLLITICYSCNIIKYCDVLKHRYTGEIIVAGYFLGAYIAEHY